MLCETCRVTLQLIDCDRWLYRHTRNGHRIMDQKNHSLDWITLLINFSGLVLLMWVRIHKLFVFSHNCLANLFAFLSSSLSFLSLLHFLPFILMFSSLSPPLPLSLSIMNHRDNVSGLVWQVPIWSIETTCTGWISFSTQIQGDWTHE